MPGLVLQLGGLNGFRRGKAGEGVRKEEGPREGRWKPFLDALSFAMLSGQSNGTGAVRRTVLRVGLDRERERASCSGDKRSIVGFSG